MLRVRQERYFDLLILLIASLAGLAYSIAWDRAPLIVPDSADYIVVAQDLQDGKLDRLHDRTSGYPVLLLLTNSARGEPSRALFFVQLSLHLVVVLLLVFLLRRSAVSKMLIALFVGLSLIPPTVAISAFVLTEPLAQFTLVVGAVSLLLWLERGSARARFALLLVSSMTFGLSALVRPAYQLLFVFVAGVLFLLLFQASHDQKAKLIVSIASVVLVSVLIVGGTAALNYRRYGYFGLTPLFGFNLSTRTVRVVERLPDEYAEIREILIQGRDRHLVGRHSSHTGVMYIWDLIPELQRVTGLDKPELSRYMLKLNLLLIKKAPLEYLKEVSRAMATFWFPRSTSLSDFNSRLLQLVWGAVHLAVMTCFFLVGSFLIGFGLLPPGLRESVLPAEAGPGGLCALFLLPLAIIFYTALTSTMFEVGNPRYRTPTDLLILFVLVLGIHLFAQVRKRAKSGRTSCSEPRKRGLPGKGLISQRKG